METKQNSKNVSYRKRRVEDMESLNVLDVELYGENGIIGILSLRL
jgi:hypothetical protein